MGVDAKLGAPDMSAHRRQRLRTLQIQDQMSLLCDTRQPIPLSVGQQHQLLPSCKGWRDAILGRCAWAFEGLVPASDSTIPASKLLECWLLSAAVLPFAPFPLPATMTHLQRSTHPCVKQEMPAVLAVLKLQGLRVLSIRRPSSSCWHVREDAELARSPMQIIFKQETSHGRRCQQLAFLTAASIEWCR